MKTKLNQSLKLAIASAIVAGSMGLSASYEAIAAVEATGTMTVSTSVLMSCTISASPMTFGSYDPTSVTDNDATATITSTCTSGGAAKITMDEGLRDVTGSTDAAPLRAMGDGGDPEQELNYQLYSDSAGGTVWGNTSTTGVPVTGTGIAQSLTAYGRIPNGQTVGAGTFSDSVSVTLTY